MFVIFKNILVFHLFWLLSISCSDEVNLDIRSICHPTDPNCAMLDYDGDGIENGYDDFPLDSRCAKRDAQHCASCDHSCSSNQICLSSGICQLALVEVCNGEDDDFDLKIDETLNPPIYEQSFGVCMGLVKICKGTQGWVNPDLSAISFYQSQEQLCDGLDNDCDGHTDEMTTDQRSQKQMGVCAGQTEVCLGTQGWGEPDYTQIIAFEREELSCDSLDNDCDGKIDEFEVSISSDCESELLGRCKAGKKTCQAGEWICQNELNPRVETCDGLDEDCDGKIDEEAINAPMPQGLGICSTLKAMCVQIEGEYQWQFQTIESLADYEIDETLCDGLDNDCDGSTDESLLPSICQISASLGECRLGEKTCQDGRWQCDAIHIPQSEDCNRLDDDCDGKIDENLYQKLALRQFGVCQGSLAFCDGQQGWTEPNYQEIPAYDLSHDSCDALDNDCDGYTDEDDQVGRTCQKIGALGICQIGLTRCSMGVLSCISSIPQTEICNGLDDDCNGKIDDALIPPPAALNLGVCQDQKKICRAELGWVEPPRPIFWENPEFSCDGLDNDCDGQVDEDLQAPLLSKQLGVCANQSQTCQLDINNQWDWVDTYDLISHYEQEEQRCDGLDNDCDGNTDEKFQGSSCFTSALGQCRFGSQKCIDGQIQCMANLNAQLESCNAIDDDCDGRLDEGLSLEQACVVGMGICQNLGQMTCQNGTYQCSAQPKSPKTEVCNAVDDDCDGYTDENIFTYACAVGVGACLSSSEWTCEQGQLICPTTAGMPMAEKCDAVDNDCDGKTDESFQVNLPCTTGLGVCFRQGFWQCLSDGTQICGNGPGLGSDEVCDGLDNDCDGQTDEQRSTEICDGLDNDCDGRLDENARSETCDGLDNDCDLAIDEQPCTHCGNACPLISWFNLPAGEYQMGGTQINEQPTHRVRLAAFMISQEISTLNYEVCTQVGYCEPALTGGTCNAGNPLKANHPINCITWAQAQTFAKWVGARLPTESQWEYAARSGNQQWLTPWGGNRIDCQFAHIEDLQFGSGCGLFGTNAICSYPQGKSTQGLCDLLGNVQEWVLDDYFDDYVNASGNGSALCLDPLCQPVNQISKVVRGSGWQSTSGNNRSREGWTPLWRSAQIGFRIVKSN